jgi:hypothetical protein
MTKSQTAYVFVLVAAAVVLASAGCGSGGPASPSDDGGGAVLRGRLVTDGQARGGGDVTASSFAAGAVGDIMVRVQEVPSIVVKVARDGSFTLRGLPSGSFTLVFTRDGATLGTQEFSGVLPNHEITITIEVVDDEVVLVEERRTGIGHGDIEIEGLVEKRLATSTTADSKFQIDGKIVLARPGLTAIREGNSARTVNDVNVGRRVHVKGVWVEGSQTDVLAHEIRLQGPDEIFALPGTSDGGKVTICHIPPGNPANAKTLEVGASAVPAHVGHGDTMGACAGGSGDKDKDKKDKDDKGKDKDKGGKK